MMKYTLPLIFFAIILSGCATFKELSPEPELLPAERGYIELKDDQENFTLEKENKYFMKFPRPDRDQFMLVLKISDKRDLQYYLTSKFDDGEGAIRTIPDEFASHDTLSAFPINTSVREFYYWVIDSVKRDVDLEMQYRYVPQWRFTFENKYTQYKQILSENTVERSTYNSIDPGFSFSNFRFDEKQASLSGRTDKIRSMSEELKKLEQVFPPNIAAARDTAYENYVLLRDKTNDELKFQDDYAEVLRVFKLEQETAGNVGKFLESAPVFSEFVSQRDRFPRPIIEKARDTFLKRLGVSTDFYDDQLRAKADTKPVGFKSSLDNARKLYEACGSSVSSDLSSLMAFVDRYNVEASAMQLVHEKFRQIDRAFDANPPWAADALYADLISKISDARAKLPDSRTTAFGKYGRYTCASMLDTEIRNAGARITASEALFQSAQQYVQQLNANAWASAEGVLRGIHTSIAYAGVPAVNDQKNTLVRAFENELFNRVKVVSQQRVDTFVRANEAAIDNVPALYNDSAFLPAYEITFSALGASEAQRKRQEVQNYIDKLKFHDFPAASIRAIYRDFTRNINDRGVDRARAIVEHGKYYKGDDRQLLSMVDECNPMIAKWIVRPKEYRKIFVVPVTTNPRGVNEYVFRVVLKIPSEAQFPVFEINVKLPKEVAEKAGTQAWYESITINKTPIKNEGRHTITAPTAGNDYESQISPVQMDKEGTNILEVRFKHSGYKVFEVSTMAQVPIIRKN